MNLRVPGPTPLPKQVREATAADMINHRGPEFKEMLAGICSGLQYLFETGNEVVLLTGSGTGGLEAAIVNLVNPGDQVVAVSIGAFGERFREIAETFGAQVTTVAAEWGQAADPDALDEALSRTPNARLVLVTHNETSTGVTNDLQALAEVVHAHDNGQGPLLVVDGISSVGSIPLRTDAWGCDIVITGSQKSWMSPPGVSMLSVSPRAWEAIESCICPRYYWDLQRARSYARKGQTPWTPAVSVLYALSAALQLMRAEGLEAIHARHRRVAQHMREGAQALGLELFADPAHVSDTVTTLRVPAGMDGDALVAKVREQGAVIAGGQGKLKGQVVRVGHLGYVDDADIDEVLRALAIALGRG